MIDTFALGISHFLLLVALWRLVQRDDLQADPVRPDPEQTESKDRAGGEATGKEHGAHA